MTGKSLRFLSRQIKQCTEARGRVTGTEEYVDVPIGFATGFATVE
jgi:hypothetical protein